MTNESSAEQPFAGLTPDVVIESLERLGIECDGRLFALNSYENRVYQVGVGAQEMRVLKFYRPGRWTDAQILEEHAFTRELLAADLPVAAPEIIDGTTLLHHAGLRYALFPRLAARAVEIDARGSLELIGRTLGRMHAVGARARFAVRPALTSERLGWHARDVLLDSPLLDESLADKYA